MPTADLLPCPFCGASGDAVIVVPHPQGWERVECFGCGAEGGESVPGGRTAAAAWNLRTPERGVARECRD